MREITRKNVWAALALLFAALPLACQGNGGETDAGPADADGSGSGDPGMADGSDAVITDTDLGDDYGLLVPEGFQACALAGFVWPENIAETLDQLGRVTFKPGLTRLCRDCTTFEADLIERVEWGAEPRIGTPVDTGTFTRQGENFTYVQEIAFGQDRMQVELRVSFEAGDDPPPGPVIELNEIVFTSYRLSLGASIGTTSMYFIACTCDEIDRGVTTYTIEGGDTVSIQVCSFCGMICKSSQGILRRAEVSFSGQDRAIEEPHQLAIRFGQHDWSANVLVYLRQPLAGYSGVVIELGTQLEGHTAHLFDQSLQVVETKTVTSTDHRPDWN